MRIFVDTNVWLAGLFGHGLCAALLETLIEAECILLANEQVMTEFRRIAKTKFQVDDTALAQAELFFTESVAIVDVATQPAAGIPDPDDAWIIASALAAQADLFVTGDKALLALGAVEGMPIFDPRAAYLRLRGLG